MELNEVDYDFDQLDEIYPDEEVETRKITLPPPIFQEVYEEPEEINQSLDNIENSKIELAVYEREDESVQPEDEDSILDFEQSSEEEEEIVEEPIKRKEKKKEQKPEKKKSKKETDEPKKKKEKAKEKETDQTKKKKESKKKEKDESKKKDKHTHKDQKKDEPKKKEEPKPQKEIIPQKFSSPKKPEPEKDSHLYLMFDPIKIKPTFFEPTKASVLNSLKKESLHNSPAKKSPSLIKSPAGGASPLKTSYPVPVLPVATDSSLFKRTVHQNDTKSETTSIKSGVSLSSKSSSSSRATSVSRAAGSSSVSSKASSRSKSSAPSVSSRSSSVSRSSSINGSESVSKASTASKASKTSSISKSSSTDKSGRKHKKSSRSEEYERYREEEELKEKLNFIEAFKHCENNNIFVRKRFTEKDSLDEMRYEFKRIKTQIDIERKSAKYWDFFSGINSSIELASKSNKTTNALAGGWSTTIEENKEEYVSIFKKLIKQRKVKSQSGSPLGQLISVLALQLLMFIVPKILNLLSGSDSEKEKIGGYPNWSGKSNRVEEVKDDAHFQILSEIQQQVVEQGREIKEMKQNYMELSLSVQAERNKQKHNPSFTQPNYVSPPTSTYPQPTRTAPMEGEAIFSRTDIKPEQKKYTPVPPEAFTPVVNSEINDMLTKQSSEIMNVLNAEKPKETTPEEDEDWSSVLFQGDVDKSHPAYNASIPASKDSAEGIMGNLMPVFDKFVSMGAPVERPELQTKRYSDEKSEEPKKQKPETKSTGKSSRNSKNKLVLD